jgi:ribosomal protein L10
MQQNLPLYQIRRDLRNKVHLTMVKAAVLPLEGTRYAGLRGMVSGGPIVLAYPLETRNKEEFLLEDIRLLLDQDPSNRTIMTLGGIVQGQLVGPTLLHRLKNLESIDVVRSELISLLQTTPRQIIQTMGAPTSQLVKVLQHRAQTTETTPTPDKDKPTG